MAQSESDRQIILKTLLIVLVGQVGCLTLVIILISLLTGLWLDNTLHTKPWLTLILLFTGIPISIVLMLQVARRTLSKLGNQKESKTEGSQ
jgi:F0F1-type ATP synthase assembly protein I